MTDDQFQTYLHDYFGTNGAKLDEIQKAITESIVHDFTLSGLEEKDDVMTTERLVSFIKWKDRVGEPVEVY
jgi:hypothetical protein